ncbi:DedA family protein [Aliirhizobium cellulosilyticum]|uniref:Membrane protein DedA with SNARE-associated domain n=1 Tax=Aliirhizobium cellulosilyticum TaxID=393664 RepID=A0A7W6V430_9HYPH|nr:DedA family protein [Rhizobium cellulosilyticum]MBB4351206.1 membrane protein DedA with SNARE-associated domain [Rhizobium cellulosilyticum]MBB4414218.1 membrane protein DedA with SNARE-associated domain [Rhizobium cellulosilyticum]MBB4448834.1 membrane protein DedA with SNARE-associated domain [Rhizobium cellulosilyticum]
MEAFVQVIMQRLGPFGIGLLMFLENVFPPIPSELIMPLAGYLATRGDMNILVVIGAGTIGSLLGTLPWYYLGRRLGHHGVRRLAENHGRWLTMSPSDVDAASDRFKRHGNSSVMLGRLIPTVRTLISVPAGVANMPLGRFLLFSSIGTLLWTAALALAGYLLGQAYSTIQDYVDPVSTMVLIILVGYYIYRVVTSKKESK